VTPTDKNNFSKLARRRLLDLEWSVQTLADKINRPRESVSRAIHSQRFPLLRKQVAQKLKLELPAA
jgi:hypothetical protein